MAIIYHLILISMLSVSLWPEFSVAAGLEKPVTRFAVFPIYGIEGKKAEEAWWQAREALTKGQSHYVAERRLMINRGVFDPRKDLKPSDSIILGKILEADALITLSVEDFNLKMSASETESGQILWKGEIPLKSTLLVEDQVGKASLDLMKQFLFDFPYQTFQAKLPDAESYLQEVEGKTFSSILRQADQDIAVGDRVQWVELIGNGQESLFQGGLILSIQAEGRVTELEESITKVEILKLRSPDIFREKAFVRLPDTLVRMQSSLGDSASRKDFLSREYLAAEIRPVKELKSNTSATASSLSWIASFGILILLAF